MKRRVQKKRMSRELRLALRASKRELGDHRRYGWQATMPIVVFDPVLGCDTEITFDPKWGRLYRPLGLLGEENGPTGGGMSAKASNFAHEEERDE